MYSYFALLLAVATAAGSPDRAALESQAREFKRLSAEIDLEMERKYPGKRRPLFTTGNDGQFDDYVNSCLIKIAAASAEVEIKPRYAEAGRRVIFSVSIRPDGTVRTVAINTNNGGPELAAFVRKSVALAAPFPPFPDLMSKKHNEVTITRTLVLSQ